MLMPFFMIHSQNHWSFGFVEVSCFDWFVMIFEARSGCQSSRKLQVLNRCGVPTEVWFEKRGSKAANIVPCFDDMPCTTQCDDGLHSFE